MVHFNKKFSEFSIVLMIMVVGTISRWLYSPLFSIKHVEQEDKSDISFATFSMQLPLLLNAAEDDEKIVGCR